MIFYVYDVFINFFKCRSYLFNNNITIILARNALREWRWLNAQPSSFHKARWNKDGVVFNSIEDSYIINEK